jgi:hypothetical protein
MKPAPAKFVPNEDIFKIEFYPRIDFQEYLIIQ